MFTLYAEIRDPSVFIDIFAMDGADAGDTARTLPISRWWDIDVYPIMPPAPLAPLAPLASAS